MLAGPRAPLAEALRKVAGITGTAMREGLGTYFGTASKAERELGWHARPLDEGLRQAVAGLSG